MSLIERAVKKLTPDSSGTPETDAASPPASLIEAAVRAAGAVSATKSPTPAAAAPAVVASAAASVASPTAVAPPAPPAPPPVVAPIAPRASVARGPVLQIALDSLRERGFITPDGPTTALSQQFRVIKRPLLANAFGRGPVPVKNGKRVMVTSALPGEGKSFCAVNLAMSIAAERDHQVLLIDADVARPALPRELGIEPGAGLMDWLIDDGVDLDSLISPTNVEKLAILPAGRRHGHATEYIASSAMTRLLDELSARFPDRLIVFDSPPLLVTTEARVLASHMGQIVMVVEAGRTPRAAVKQAVETIEGCEVVGMLLNKAPESRAGGYGYYGYDGYGPQASR